MKSLVLKKQEGIFQEGNVKGAEIIPVDHGHGPVVDVKAPGH